MLPGWVHLSPQERWVKTLQTARAKEYKCDTIDTMNGRGRSSRRTASPSPSPSSSKQNTSRRSSRSLACFPFRRNFTRPMCTRHCGGIPVCTRVEPKRCVKSPCSTSIQLQEHTTFFATPRPERSTTPVAPLRSNRGHR